MILAIDPGTTESGCVILDGKDIFECGVMDNHYVLDLINSIPVITDTDFNKIEICCEMVASYGMAVGKTVFETCVWIGRFEQASIECGFSFEKVYRGEVKDYLCKSRRAKDANIRQAIIDMYEPTGGGKTPQIGTKKEPGPLYGVKSHVWAALGVGLTYRNKLENQK